MYFAKKKMIHWSLHFKTTSTDRKYNNGVTVIDGLKMRESLKGGGGCPKLQGPVICFCCFLFGKISKLLY